MFYKRKTFQAGLQLGCSMYSCENLQGKNKTAKKQTRDVMTRSAVTKVKSKLTTAHFSAAEE